MKHHVAVESRQAWMRRIYAAGPPAWAKADRDAAMNVDLAQDQHRLVGATWRRRAIGQELWPHLLAAGTVIEVRKIANGVRARRIVS